MMLSRRLLWRCGMLLMRLAGSARRAAYASRAARPVGAAERVIHFAVSELDERTIAYAQPPRILPGRIIPELASYCDDSPMTSSIVYSI
jgi:hypothetical protein